MGIENTNISFRSMTYLALKFEFKANVSFRNRMLISVASKLWTRMECGIPVPIHAPYRQNLIIGS